MATYTTNYNLDKYEGTDRPNLRDQYNSAMDKIDAALYTEQQTVNSHTNSITALQAAQIAASARMDVQDQNIATANTNADNAVAQAYDAATDASQALTQLDGNSLKLVNPSNFSEYFSYPSDTVVDTSKPVQFDAILIGSGNARKALITFTFTTRAITTSDYNKYLHVFNIRGWKSSNQEAHEWLIFEYGTDFHVSSIFPAASSATPSTVSINMTPAGPALVNGMRLTATIMVDLIPA